MQTNDRISHAMYLACVILALLPAVHFVSCFTQHPLCVSSSKIANVTQVIVHFPVTVYQYAVSKYELCNGFPLRH